MWANIGCVIRLGISYFIEVIVGGHHSLKRTEKIGYTPVVLTSLKYVEHDGKSGLMGGKFLL